jgi:SNF2 family DNA or RNA helicase
MMSLWCEGNNLEISFESKMGPNLYRDVMQTFGSLPGAVHDEENYKWFIPKEHVDVVAQKYEDIIAWHTSLDDIKGIQEVVLPEFEVTDEGLEDMKLKPYPFQILGICFLHDNKRGVMGDEMGLGKTPTAIGAIHRLHKEGLVQKTLVICPASLKYQWRNEIDKFTDHKGIVIDGTAKQKKEQIRQFLEEDYLFAIINYELVRTMEDVISALPIQAVIADEAHRIKNRASKTYKAMMKIQPEYRFALTGTPMQNKLEELHTLFSWVDKTILPNITNFRKRYVVYGEKFGRKFVPLGNKRQYEIRRMISKSMLRRMKKEVAQELPEMTFHRYDIPMTKEQAELYDKIKEDFSLFLQEIGDFAKNAKGEFQEGEWKQEKHPKEDMILGYMNLMLAAADDPFLLRMSEGGMAKKYLHLVSPDIKSPKLDELHRICEDLVDAGTEKVVIFTQFTRMQRRVLTRLMKIGACEIINGSMKPFQRQQAVDNFRWKKEVKFLICTDAANFGLNLQFANTLIHVDSPYNPAIFDQRNGRVHRIGGEHDSVNILYLVTQGTIDERIQEILETKRQLSKQVVERNENERVIMDSLMKKLAI